MRAHLLFLVSEMKLGKLQMWSQLFPPETSVKKFPTSAREISLVFRKLIKYFNNQVSIILEREMKIYSRNKIET